MKEQLADLVHPVRVAGGVFKAGEESTAHSHGAVQTSGHIGCNDTFRGDVLQENVSHDKHTPL